MKIKFKEGYSLWDNMNWKAKIFSAGSIYEASAVSDLGMDPNILVKRGTVEIVGEQNEMRTNILGELPIDEVDELKSKKLDELKEIAKEIGLKVPQGTKKEVYVYSIIKGELPKT